VTVRIFSVLSISRREALVIAMTGMPELALDHDQRIYDAIRQPSSTAGRSLRIRGLADGPLKERTPNPTLSYGNQRTSPCMKDSAISDTMSSETSKKSKTAKSGSTSCLT